jgi:hypothetical protein
MPTPDRAEFKRLILQIERDLLAQARLRTLLTNAGVTVAGHRNDLKTVEARLRTRKNGLARRRSPTGRKRAELDSDKPSNRLA